MMLSMLLIALFAAVACIDALPGDVTRLQAVKFRSPRHQTKAIHVLNLTRQPGSQSAKLLHALRAAQRDATTETTLAPVIPAAGGAEFLTVIEWAGKEFQVILDTGSSDTWLVQSNFTCYTGALSPPVDQALCRFGPLWTPDSTFEAIPNVNFNITYGDGEFLTGIMANESVTLGSITVLHQEVGIANMAAWNGDGISSGLLGLAFPAITSAFAGTDPRADNPPSTQVLYSPLFTNMYRSGAILPVFSLAIERDNNTGVLALGGLPPCPYVPPFAAAPFEILTLRNALNTQYQFYAVNVTLVYTAASTNSTSTTRMRVPRLRAMAAGSAPPPIEIIVDSGTTLLYLPTHDVAAINALYSPPAQYNWLVGAWRVACNATAPALGVQVGAKVFAIDSRDMVLANGDGTCITAVVDAGAGLNILGDVFLKNVLAVFDVGQSEMRFAARK